MRNRTVKLIKNFVISKAVVLKRPAIYEYKESLKNDAEAMAGERRKFYAAGIKVGNADVSALFC